MTLSRGEEAQLDRMLDPVLGEGAVQRMKAYIQHGKITTYEHCKRVARVSFWLNRRLHLHAEEKSLVTGAMLHDFFLYDWHEDDGGAHRLHGFTHPKAALENARKYFRLSRKEEDIIENHMWPLTLRHVPRSREALIVCAADKLCSAGETLFMR